MDSYDNTCRICLTTNVFFDWTEAVFEFSGPSYKQCYYQYTHLLENDKDLHTSMLCLECGNGLRNAYILVQKALESNLKLKEIKYKVNADNPLQFDKDENVISLDISKSPLQFEKEQVLLSDIQNSFNTTIEDCSEASTDKKEHYVLTEAITMWTSSNEELLDVDIPINQDSDSTSELEVNKSSTVDSDSEVKTKKELILLCSYCSRTFNNRNHLIKHEKTHERNRKRTESCAICGLKFYCKSTLKSHMVIHDDNRERNYKCEFCPKAFFARGALNVHRRIHLGQMIKCNFCPKEFYRQIDLDRHMKSHDVTPLTANTGITPIVRVKYFRECDICGDRVKGAYWKHHKAKHLNQPSSECLICGKQFFPRTKVIDHFRKCHGIDIDEYEKFVKKLANKFEPRLTPLMIEQKVTKVYTEK